MSSRARVEFEPMYDGVKLALWRADSRLLMTWIQPEPVYMGAEGVAGLERPDGEWLMLAEDDARAIYEALAEFFGHAPGDMRILRSDYDKERSRVDKMIDYLLRV